MSMHNFSDLFHIIIIVRQLKIDISINTPEFYRSSIIRSDAINQKR